MEQIILNGRPCSKKNSRKAIYNRASGKMIFIAGDAYERFKEDALWQLKRFRKFTGHVKIDYEFYIKGKLRQDVDNAITSVNDVLQDAGLIENDDYIEAGSFKKYRNAPDWKTCLTISRCDPLAV